MQLTYENKKSKEDILNKAKNMNICFDCPTNTSLLFKWDNFCVLSALLNTHNSKIDLIYIDPPFNTSQDFFISENRANAISCSKNDKIAYSDKTSKEEYLEFMRERLILLKELLSDKGSIYLHIDYKMGHYVKLIMDEIFGEENFKNDITRIKSNPKNFFRRAYGNEKNLILFYSKNYQKNIWNDIKIPLSKDEIISRFPKIDEHGRRYNTIPLHAPGETLSGETGQPLRDIPVPPGRHWRTNPSEFDKLDSEGKIEWSCTGNPRIKKYADEHKGKKIQDVWVFKDPQKPKYPTEKNSEMLKQIILQSSEADSIVLDCFAGGGSTLKSAHSLGRKWIGVDKSDAAIDIIKRSDIGEFEFLDFSNYTV